MQNWRRFLTSCGFMLLYGHAHAWSAKGHVLITEMSLQQLPKAQQQVLAHYAAVLTDALPVLLQQQLADAYAGASDFAKLSPLPDRWRDMTLGQLFASLAAPLPKALTSYRDQSTQGWHFIDRPYPANRQCQRETNVNVISALTLLQQAWHDTNNETARAVLLVLMTHLVEDAHQPLHMLSRTTPTCRQDAGGNKRFVLVGQSRPMKLHQWWDSAGGYLSHRIRFDEQAVALRTRFGNTYMTDEVNNLNPSQWAEEAYALAPFIYTAASNRHLSRPYAAKSQAVACQRMALASNRLTAWLMQLDLVLVGAPLSRGHTLQPPSS